MSSKSVKQECLGKSANKERRARVSSKSVKQECLAKSVKKECQARVSSKSVQQECQERVSRKSVKQECPVKIVLSRVSSKSVKQECPARVSSKNVERVSGKSVLPRVSSKRVLSRVPCKTLLLLDDSAGHLHKEKTSIFISALVSAHSALHKVTAFGFVGSIRFFSKVFCSKCRFCAYFVFWHVVFVCVLPEFFCFLRFA